MTLAGLSLRSDHSRIARSMCIHGGLYQESGGFKIGGPVGATAGDLACRSARFDPTARTSVRFERAFHPASDDSNPAGPVHGEEAEEAVEVHTHVGDFVACFGRCAARHRAEGGDGGGLEALGEESGQHFLGPVGDGQRDWTKPGPSPGAP